MLPNTMIDFDLLQVYNVINRKEKLGQNPVRLIFSLDIFLDFR